MYGSNIHFPQFLMICPISNPSQNVEEMLTVRQRERERDGVLIFYDTPYLTAALTSLLNSLSTFKLKFKSS